MRARFSVPEIRGQAVLWWHANTSAPPTRAKETNSALFGPSQSGLKSSPLVRQCVRGSQLGSCPFSPATRLPEAPRANSCTVAPCISHVRALFLIHFFPHPFLTPSPPPPGTFHCIPESFGGRGLITSKVPAQGARPRAQPPWLPGH